MTRKMLAARVGGLLRKTRLNQEDIAKVLDIPRTALYNLKDGTRDLSAFEALKLCQLFDMSPDEFFCWREAVTREDGQ